MFVAHIAERTMKRLGILAGEKDRAALASRRIGYRWLLWPDTIGLEPTSETRGYVAVAGASRPLGFVLS